MPLDPGSYLKARHHVIECVRTCLQAAGGDESRALEIWLDMLRQGAGPASRRRTSAGMMTFVIAADLLKQLPALPKPPKPRRGGVDGRRTNG